MPINTGRKPRFERVDIILRNGIIVRNVDPEKWRWRSWPEGESAGDIMKWAVAGTRDRWVEEQRKKG